MKQLMKTLFTGSLIHLLLFAGLGWCQTTLLWDDFKSGSADNWELVSGAGFEVVDEALCLQTT
jgi:hypothetical protein